MTNSQNTFIRLPHRSEVVEIDHNRERPLIGVRDRARGTDDMPAFSRRSFLIRGSVGAAAAAIATAIPSMPSLVTAAEEDAPAVDDAGTSAIAAVPSNAQPLIAHVTDLGAGRMSLFMGEREFTVVDKSLAGRLFGAAK